MSEYIIAVAHMAGAAGLGWTLHHFAGIDPVTAVLTSGMAFVISLHLQGLLTRGYEARKVQRDIDNLREAHKAMRVAVQESKKTIAEASQQLTKRTETQEKKMVGELKLIEGLIRDFTIKAAARVASIPAGQFDHEEAPVVPPPVFFREMLGDPAMLELIRRSLEDNRVDLYLQPVVSLPQRKVRFYEALTRLRSEDGAVIMPEQYIRIAAPAGLMSVVDNLLLFRCVQVVRRMAQRTRDVAVFCNISGHTLNDAEFFPQFLDFMHHHKDLASQIVFEFGEDAVLGAGPAEEANLRYLATLGFRLSMDQVTKLDLDFGRLKRLGFQYVKVRAGTLISGMRAANAQVAAEDVKNLLLRHGINLIVEKIEDEKTVVQLLEFNVDYGQGFLFGEPKPIREFNDIHEPRTKELAGAGAALPAPLTRRLAS